MRKRSIINMDASKKFMCCNCHTKTEAKKSTLELEQIREAAFVLSLVQIHYEEPLTGFAPVAGIQSA